MSQTHPYTLAVGRSYLFLTACSSIAGKYQGSNDTGYWVVKTATNQIVAINPDQVITYMGA